jgi:hypothetical protein
MQAFTPATGRCLAHVGEEVGDNRRRRGDTHLNRHERLTISDLHVSRDRDLQDCLVTKRSWGSKAATPTRSGPVHCEVDRSFP